MCLAPALALQQHQTCARRHGRQRCTEPRARRKQGGPQTAPHQQYVIVNAYSNWLKVASSKKQRFRRRPLAHSFHRSGGHHVRESRRAQRPSSRRANQQQHQHSREREATRRIRRHGRCSTDADGSAGVRSEWKGQRCHLHRKATAESREVLRSPPRIHGVSAVPTGLAGLSGVVGRAAWRPHAEPYGRRTSTETLHIRE